MVDIINYRGGKALVIDSLDIVRMKAYLNGGIRFRQTMRDLVEVPHTKVDYILVITSYPMDQLPLFLCQAMSDSTDRINCYRVNLRTAISTTRDWDTLLAQPSGLEEVIEKLKTPAEITTEYREMTIKALKEMSEMYDLVGADTDGVFVKEKEEKKK